MKKTRKLLFVTNSHPVQINHILEAFKTRPDLNVKVLDLYFDKPVRGWFVKLAEKTKLPIDLHCVNKRLLSTCATFEPHIVFIVKGNLVFPCTLSRLKANFPMTKFISWSQDDMYAKHNRSLYYTFGLKYYDLVVTQKSYNVDELTSLGAKRVLFQNKAYSRVYHKLLSERESEGITNYGSDVLFIGYAEKQRFDDLQYLAINGVKVSIFGSGWNQLFIKSAHPNLKINPYDLHGYEYAWAIANSKIALCFLRKVNRDLQTSRSIEIPACGGFMLAERTEEHQQLFIEDEEAVYFNSKEELLQKVKYYLVNENERRQILNNGVIRVANSNYSYEHRVTEILELINEG